MNPSPPSGRTRAARNTSLRAAGLGPLALAVLLLAGCAAQLEHRKGLDLLAEGKTSEAVESLQRANTLAPDNLRYRVDYLNQRDVVAKGFAITRYGICLHEFERMAYVRSCLNVGNSGCDVGFFA